MRRWHSPREEALMLRRWRQELANHTPSYSYCSLAPAVLAEGISCHCARGKGTMRKMRPFEQGGWWRFEKRWENKRIRREKYAVIEEQLYD